MRTVNQGRSVGGAFPRCSAKPREDRVLPAIYIIDIKEKNYIFNWFLIAIDKFSISKDTFMSSSPFFTTRCSALSVSNNRCIFLPLARAIIILPAIAVIARFYSHFHQFPLSRPRLLSAKEGERGRGREKQRINLLQFFSSAVPIRRRVKPVGYDYRGIQSFATVGIELEWILPNVVLNCCFDIFNFSLISVRVRAHLSFAKRLNTFNIVSSPRVSRRNKMLGDQSTLIRVQLGY